MSALRTGEQILMLASCGVGRPPVGLLVSKQATRLPLLQQK